MSIEELLNKIHNVDCLDFMKSMPDNCVDSIVTDPPYGLSFMGKKWDYDVPSIEIWKECLRVLKPGGYLLSFAGTRTQHRMAVNIEDAGFEIRDMIAWVYGSGFPKSLNIGKAVDKLQGNEREITGVDRGHTGERVNNHEGIHDDDNYEWKGDFNVTKGTSEWEGWGTALKPALEPITVARKPFKGTVAENVLKYGTGGINIDGCRVGTGDRRMCGTTDKSGETSYVLGAREETRTEQGRFPANFIHDGSDEVVELFPNTKSNSKNSVDTVESNKSTFGSSSTRQVIRIADVGSASRFFYCSKASKQDRNEGCEGLEEKMTGMSGGAQSQGEGYSEGQGIGLNRVTAKLNHHPTVKPTKLMQYLVRLVTPKEGIVLDPFTGSGSTGKACMLEGFNFIGIERDEEYCKIAEERIRLFNQQLRLF
jgi:DNA modification methylase